MSREYLSLVRLSKNIVENYKDLDLYIDAVNEHLKKIQDKERLNYFGKFICYLLFHLRANATNGVADAFAFDSPEIARKFMKMSAISDKLADTEIVQKEMNIIIEKSTKDRCGEMKYFVEEEFENALFGEMRKSLANA